MSQEEVELVRGPLVICLDRLADEELKDVEAAICDALNLPPLPAAEDFRNAILTRLSKRFSRNAYMQSWFRDKAAKEIREIGKILRKKKVSERTASTWNDALQHVAAAQQLAVDGLREDSLSATKQRLLKLWLFLNETGAEDDETSTRWHFKDRKTWRCSSCWRRTKGKFHTCSRCGTTFWGGHVFALVTACVLMTIGAVLALAYDSPGAASPVGFAGIVLLLVWVVPALITAVRVTRKPRRAS